MKKDGVYYCMHKRDVMCAHAKKTLTSIMKRFWLKFHNFSPKKPQKNAFSTDLARALNYGTTTLRNFTNDQSLTGTSLTNAVINIKIPISHNTPLRTDLVT